MRSDTVKTGMQQAPHRSLFNALGMTKEELKKPLVGIVSSYNEIVPGHMNLDKIVEAVKLGVAMAGGTPIVFPAIAVCDGIAMGHVGMKYSLVTRDLIADSTECMAMAHQFDALVMVPNCDKNVPGLLMAAARLNMSLAERAEMLHIVPSSHGVEEALNMPGAKVLMKAGSKMGLVRQALIASDMDAYMVENCGMDTEHVYMSAEEIPENAGYFSLIIARDRRKIK